MKHVVCTLFFSIGAIIQANSQNLVLNPSFEEYVPDSVNGGNGNGDIAKATH